MSTITWWHADLKSPGVDEIIDAKFEAGEKMSFSYVKQIKRVFALKDEASLINKLMSQAQIQLLARNINHSRVAYCSFEQQKLILKCLCQNW